MRREEEYDMEKIHSRLFLTMFYTLMFLVMVGLCGCSGGGGSSDSTSIADPPAKIVLASIAIQPADNHLAVGKTQQFTAIGTYSDKSTSDLSSTVSWSSSSPSVATITPNGMATTVTAGQTTITATVGGVSGTTTLTVPATTLVSITIAPSSSTIAINTAQQFTATGAYSDGTSKILTSGVTWSSSDTSKAAIAADGDGKASAVGAGTATITAISGGKTANATLNVTSATLKTIAVTPSNPVIAAGTTQQFSATGTFSDSTTQDLTTQVTWSSSVGSIATIAADGKASAVGAGTATITAASGGISATTSLTVTTATLKSIAVTPLNPVIAAGTTQQFSAKGTFSDSSTQDLTTQVTWSSSAISIASIAQNGTATGVADGTATITATSGSISGSQNLKVTLVAAVGTWEGTYTIPKGGSLDPIQEGTYAFKLVLNQSGTSVAGTSSLRYIPPGLSAATGTFTFGKVTGSTIDFTFTYIDSYSHLMVNTGKAEISDTSMTGNVDENYNEKWNCSYSFSLKKL